VDSQGTLDTLAWAQRVLNIARLPDQEQVAPELCKACELAAQVENRDGDKLTGWGEGYSTYQAGLEMAEILADLQLDRDTLVAAVLYRSVREGKLTEEAIENHFGATVANLISGVRRMAAISSLTNHSGHSVFGKESTEQAENVRKMLVAMIDDVRVALIKLAE